MIKIYRNYPTKILVDKEDLMKVFLASENEIAEIDESNSLAIFQNVINVVNLMNETNMNAKAVLLDTDSLLSRFLIECVNVGKFNIINNLILNEFPIINDDVFVYSSLQTNKEKHNGRSI